MAGALGAEALLTRRAMRNIAPNAHEPGLELLLAERAGEREGRAVWVARLFEEDAAALESA